MQIGTPAPPPAEPQGREFLPPGTRDHEHTDASVRLIILLALAMVVGAVLMQAVVFGYLTVLSKIEPWGQPHVMPPPDVRPVPPPEPRLQIDEEGDAQRIHAQEDARISAYEWVDKPAGIVRIPVTRAMELTAQRGLPKWGDDAPGPKDEPKKTNTK